MSSRRVRSGGSVDAHDREPVQEIGPEAPGGDLGVEIVARRGDHADVDLASRLSPPSGRTTRSSSTRSRRACTVGEIRPSSSRNSVPPCGARDHAGARVAPRR